MKDHLLQSLRKRTGAAKLFRSGRDGRFQVAQACVLAIAVCIAHWPGLNGEFVFDDFINIVENDEVAKGFSFRSLFRLRGVAIATLHLNHALGGLDPKGYHILNLGIHLCATFSLWMVLQQLLIARSRHWPESIQRWRSQLAWSIALLWGVHPITTQAVAYTIQRMESLWSLGFLVGFGYYLSATAGPSTDSLAKPWWRKSWKFLMSIACFWLAMGCKEPLALSLLALPMSDRLFGHWLTKPQMQAIVWWKGRLGYYALLCAPFIIGLPLFVVPLVFSTEKDSSAGFFTANVGVLEYWRTQPEVALAYLRLIIAPVNQCIDYLWPVQESIVRVMAAVSVWVLACGIIVRSYIMRQPWVLFPILFLLNISTTCLVPLADVMVEHRVYLASAWIIGGLTLGLVTLVGSCQEKIWRVPARADRQTADSLSSRRFPLGVGLVGCLCVAIVALILGTRSRSALYQSNLLLWKDAANTAPWNYRAKLNYASAVLDETQWTQGVNVSIEKSHAERSVNANAMAQYVVGLCKDALELDSFRRQPDHQRAKGWSILASGLAESDDLSAAVKAAQRAIELTPGTSNHWVRLADVYARHQHWEEAAEALNEAIRNRPKRADLYQKLAMIQANSGLYQDAHRSLVTAREFASHPLPELELQAAQTAWMLGQTEDAVQVIRRWPDERERLYAWRQLAGWLDRAERWDESRLAWRYAGVTSSNNLVSGRSEFRAAINQGDLQRAREIILEMISVSKSKDDQAYWQAEQALLLHRQKQEEQASDQLTRLTKEYPKSARVWSAMGDLRRWNGQTDDAIQCYQRAYTLGQDDSFLLNNLGALLSQVNPLRAEIYLRQAVQVQPTNYQAWHSLGNNHVRMNQLNQAIQCYERALEVNPEFMPSAEMLRKLADLAKGQASKE